MVSRSRAISMLISISAKPGFFSSARSQLAGRRARSRVQSVFATAVALRGAWVIAAISPKISPFFTVPIGFLPASRLTSPSSSR